MRQESRKRIGIYGLGVVAPGASNVAQLEARLRSGSTALRTVSSAALGHELFAVGDPDFSFEDYASWIGARHGDAYFHRMKRKMGDNVRFAVGATIQALESQAGLERLVREADGQCHVYIGSGVGDLPESRAAALSLDRATRLWNQFWASPKKCEARRRYEGEGTLPDGVGATALPPNPKTFPEDTVERAEAAAVWDAYWASQSRSLAEFWERFAAIERQDAAGTGETAQLDAIRGRVRAHRALLQEASCPPPPFSSVSANLIWNIQNAPAAQVTMLLGVHGAAWAPVGACSTFGVALKCGRDAILRGEAKMAIIGTTDPRPEPALMGAFHEGKVMTGSGEVHDPLTNLRGTHLSGGACVWILGDEDYLAASGIKPLGWLEAATLSSDAEHIITPSATGPKRALRQAYADASIEPKDVAIFDLHATGTPGDLTEIALIQEFISSDTRITARKGQLGHGMANSGGWELTALVLGLAQGEAWPTGIRAACIHARIAHHDRIVCEGAPLRGAVGVKLMLGIGGITSCVVIRCPS